MTDIVEQMAQAIAEAMNGGEFDDGKWYTEGQRQAWRNAVTPYIDEIERLRGDNAELLKALIGLYEAVKWEKVAVEVDLARAAIVKATGATND